MIGTFINVAAILVGGFFGLLFGARLPERLKATIIIGMGLFVAVTGIQMFLQTQNSLIVLGAVVIGALLGEWWQIEAGLEKLGEVIESRFNRPKMERTRSIRSGSKASNRESDLSGEEILSAEFHPPAELGSLR